jgi:ribosome-interacting GTPase 1
MPANLTPQYKDAEQRYKQAKTPEEKLACLKEMLSIMPKHKGTEKLQADLKTRIAKLEDAEERQQRRKGHDPYHVPRGEAPQIVLAGAPNVGKSSFVAATTNAHPEIGDFPFTTQLPLVAMMPVLDLQFELVDTPPVPENGMPPWFPNIVRQSSAVLLLGDLSRDEGPFEAQAILDQLERSRVHLTRSQHEMRDDGTCFRRCLLVGTKSDAPGAPERIEEYRILFGERLPVFATSAKAREGFREVGQALFDALGIIRVYTKLPGHPPDMKRPYVLPDGSRVKDLAARIHKDLVATLKHARIWGTTAAFGGQQVHGEHVLGDGDIVEIHAA